MGEEKKSISKNGTIYKVLFLKYGKKLLKLAFIIAIICCILVASVYYILKDDFETVSKKNKTYKAKVDSSGQVVYTQTPPADEENAGDTGDAGNSGNTGENTETNTETKKEPVVVTVDDMAKDLYEDLDEYISSESEEEGIEVVKKLINAEIVTRTPYREDVKEGEIIGQVKFYRYTGEGEANSAYSNDGKLNDKHRITYVTPTKFADLKNRFVSNKGEETVFNHFTMDDEGNVIIAYGSIEKRDITTENVADPNLTLEMVKQESGEETYTETYRVNDKKVVFNMERYTIYERKIDYLSLVEQYVMPSNLLYSFLIQTRDINFVNALADLAYNNEIGIAIYDNESYYEENMTHTYKQVINMDGSIKLKFDGVETEYPKMTGEDFKKDKTIISSCEFKVNEGTCTHDHRETEKPSTDENMYVAQYDKDGKIKKLENESNAAVFTVKYKKTIEAKSSPTVGVILADTWIAKWKADYTREEQEAQNSSNSSDDNEDFKLAQYDKKSDLLSIFNDGLSKEIDGKLTKHGDKLKKDAIEHIMDGIDFTVKPEPNLITTSDLDKATRKNIFEQHYGLDTDGCPECKEVVSDWYFEVLKEKGINEDLTKEEYDKFKNVDEDDGALKGTIVEIHYKEALSIYVDGINDKERDAAQEIADQRTKQRRDNFRKALEGDDDEKKGIQIEYKLKGNHNYVDIKFEQSTKREASKYVKSENVELTETGVKFKEVFNNTDFYKAKQAILARDGWFWEYIQENDDTAKLEDIIRYLLNIATDSEHFGTFTAEEITDLFKAFAPKEDMKSASISGMKLLRDYIRSFENRAVLNYINGESGYTDYIAKYISEDKTTYYIRDDGANHPTVGFGVDIYRSGFLDRFYEMGYTDSQLKDISGAVEVPVDFVDALEEEEIESNIKAITKRTSSLNLENYQIYALVSRAYNCGLGGALKESGFVDAYTKYFNPEEDIKYGEILGDFGHSLYTEYMDVPITSDGKVLQGLITRRKSEWTLFQTGYMDTLGRFVSSGDILTIADDIHKQQMTWVYYTDHPKGANSLYWNNIEASINNANQSTCCATYVSTVLYQAGYANEEELNDINYNICIDVYHLLKNKGWAEITSAEELEARRYSIHV